MLEFRITIGSPSRVILEPINEPIGFDKTDFNLKRDKDYFSVTNQFAGNKHDFRFTSHQHESIINELFKEYETKGFNGFASLVITKDETLLFVGTLDFSTCVTDMVNYFDCQVIVKDKLSVLDDNKSVKVDLLGSKDLQGNNAPILPLESIYVDSLEIRSVSRWEHEGVKTYPLNGTANTTRVSKKYDIKNSLSWLSNNVGGSSPNAKRRFKLIDAKENLKNVNVKINYGDNTLLNFTEIQSKVEMFIAYGVDYEGLSDVDWFNGLTEVLVWSSNGIDPVKPNNVNYTIPIVPRNHGVWVYMVTSIADFTDDNSSIEISAITQDFSSIVSTSKYQDLIANTIRKASGINNIEFIGLEEYDLNYVFNGNLLRNITNKPFYSTWNEIKEQLKERCIGVGYNATTDTMTLAHRDYFYTDKEIIAIGDYQKFDFYEDKPDPDFIINSFKYEYKKYQSQKENEVIGNSGSVHGESEWYLKNRNVSGDLSVSLPFVRDSFMIEDIRRKSIEYNENTSTNEDDTIIILETQATQGQINITESVFLQASFSDGLQTFKNDLTFSWINIGIVQSEQVFVDGWGYVVSSVDHNIIILQPNLVNTPQLNSTKVYEFTYYILKDYKSKMESGLFNQAFSIRQNIQYWRGYLDSCNYYSGSNIDNTFYKENRNSVYNGLREDSSISTIRAKHYPRLISGKLRITTTEFDVIKSDTRGFIRVLDSNNNPVRLYIDDLDAVFLDGCDLMEANITGKLRIKPTYINVYKGYIIENYGEFGDVQVRLDYLDMSFLFNDENETVTIIDENGIPIYKDEDRLFVCGNICFGAYNQMKNYLLYL